MALCVPSEMNKAFKEELLSKLFAIRKANFDLLEMEGSITDITLVPAGLVELLKTNIKTIDEQIDKLR